MRHALTLLLVTWTSAGFAGTARTASTQPVEGVEAFQSVRAILRAEQRHIHTGGAVWVDFMLYNASERPVRLEVPEAVRDVKKQAAMGLPVEHIFSGERFRALKITDGQGKVLGADVMLRPSGAVAPVVLAPHALVGVRIDLGEHYSAVRRTGTYELEWRPYGGAVISNTLRLEIKQHRQVVIVTNMGRMRLRLLYDKAPRTVANFLELVEEGFYSRTQFYRIYPGAAILGGDPNNDGTGMRQDGKTVPAEFNDTPFDEGTVAMSLAGNDPDSASCQFFICLRRIPQWDGKYTAFAQVVGVESLETLRKIGQTKTDERDRPMSEVIVERMDIQSARRDSSPTLTIGQ